MADQCPTVFSIDVKNYCLYIYKLKIILQFTTGGSYGEKQQTGG